MMPLSSASRSRRSAAGGLRAVSGSYDQTLKVWDISTGLNAGLESGEAIASFSAEGALWACAVAPDGVTIVAGDIMGRVHILRLEGVE
jgi:WD40 repeat protein